VPPGEQLVVTDDDADSHDGDNDGQPRSSLHPPPDLGGSGRGGHQSNFPILTAGTIKMWFRSMPLAGCIAGHSVGLTLLVGCTDD
jgi:hypothetical protein